MKKVYNLKIRFPIKTEDVSKKEKLYKVLLVLDKQVLSC